MKHISMNKLKEGMRVHATNGVDSIEGVVADRLSEQFTILKDEEKDLYAWFFYRGTKVYLIEEE